jgi:phage shock protein B
VNDVVPIILVAVCAPLWIIFHYISKIKAAKGLTPEDEKMLTEVWESTKKMEDRIITLERILDIESPRWRQRHE